MLAQKKEIIEQHIKTHTERSAQDRAAVSVLETFLRSDGRINTNFSSNDKWPNTDGTFEFVLEPDISRSPQQNFFVQIKGTRYYKEEENMLKYSLQSLAFPAHICCHVTLDPGILFVVLNPDERGQERVFWKYMSMEFINAIDFNKASATIRFSPEEEIKNTDESIHAFCDKLAKIVKRHLFIRQLDEKDYTKEDVVRLIRACDEQITESIDRFDIVHTTRDAVSSRILNRLYDLCSATLLLNTLKGKLKAATLQFAWERSLLNINTKYLGTFLRGLKYIGNRVPDEGQSERLMLKYYDFLWQIREYLSDQHAISVLHNLEKFPIQLDELDYQYYNLAANAVNGIQSASNPLGKSRFYVQKKTPFYIGTERYYEVTLQLAGVYASKYNRITAYTKTNISTNYSVQIGYTDAAIDLWGIDSNIKVITNWAVSIEPSCLNKLAKILNIRIRLSSKHNEYGALMEFLTKTGINFLDMINLQESTFLSVVERIYKTTKTAIFKEVLLALQKDYAKGSIKYGRHVIRYLLLYLKEETLERVLPNNYNSKRLCKNLYLSSSCIPFERNPFIYNLTGSRTSEGNQIQSIIHVAGSAKIDVVRPYLTLKNAVNRTGEIYFEASAIASEDAIHKYNACLTDWERGQGNRIIQNNGFVCIESYEQSTIGILQTLLEFSTNGNEGQREFNQNYINQNKDDLTDDLKRRAMENAFVDSQLLLIYGAAGTGKTTLINYISNMMGRRNKLFLTKTHTALQNLERRIDNPGPYADFVSFDSFTKKVSLPDYDIIFVDEGSAIDNRTMLSFLRKIGPNTFLVLAGDIYQIESIDFGNWFFYAKEIIKANGAQVELLSTWRTRVTTLRIKQTLLFAGFG